MNSTEICNMALSIVTRVRINSLDEDREEAKECKTYYDHERRRLLKMYDWGFARRVRQLGLRDNRVLGWAYCYGYPQECLQVRFVFDEEHAEKKEMERQEFQVVNFTGNDRVICTNVWDAWAEFMADVKDTELFSDEFTNVLVHMLAADLAIPLTGSSDLQNAQLQFAQQSLTMAMLENANEQERHTQYPTKYAQARFR